MRTLMRMSLLATVVLIVGHLTKTGGVSGFLVPDTFFSGAYLQAVVSSSPGANDSTYKEAQLEVRTAPDSGNFTDISGGRMIDLDATGQPSDAVSITIDAVKPGQVDATATFSYTQSSVTYGHTEYDVLTGFETMIYSTSASGYRAPRMITIPASDIVVSVVEDWINNDTISYSRTTSGAWSAGGSVYASYTAFTASRHPSGDLWAVPVDSTTGVDLFYISFDQSGNSAQARIDRSTDGGATWAPWATNVLEFTDANSVTYDQIRVVYDELNRSLRMAIHKDNGGTHSGLHYVSVDYGASWTLVETVSDVRVHDMKINSCGTILYTYFDGATTTLKVKRGDGSVTTFSSLTTPSETFITSELAMAVIPGDWFVVYGRKNGNQERVIRYVSKDSGATWTVFSNDSNITVSNITRDNDAASFSEGIIISAAAHANGQTLVFGNVTAPTTTIDYSIVGLVFGQWTNITQGVPYSEKVYYPTALPGAMDWTDSGGAGTAAVTSRNSDMVLQIVTAANERSFSEANANPVQKLFARVEITSGGSTAADDFILKMAPFDGANSADIRIRFAIAGTISIAVRDQIAASTLGSATGITAGVLDILAEVNTVSDVASVWYKSRTSNQWTNIISNTTVGAGAATNEVRFGGVSVAGTATGYIHVVAFGGYADPGDNLANGFAASQIYGARASRAPQRLPNGIFAAFRGGPLSVGDQWTVSTFSRASFEYALPTGNVHDPRINYVGATDTPPLGTKRAVFSRGSSWRGKLSNNLEGIGAIGLYGIETLRLTGWDGAGYATHATVNCYEGISSPAWTRTAAASNHFRPNGTNSYPRAWEPNELKRIAWAAEIQDAAGNRLVAEIEHNDEGQFSNASGVLQAGFRLNPTPLVGTYAALATSASGGSTRVRFYLRNVVGIVTVPANETLQYFRFEWDVLADITHEEIGKIMAGPFYPLGRQERHGSSMEQTDGDQIKEIPGGVQIGSRVTRPVRAWTLPIEQIYIDQYRHNGGGAANTMGPGSTARALQDNPYPLIAELQQDIGRSRPIIFLPPPARKGGDYSGSTAEYYGDAVAYGWLSKTVQQVATRGQTRGNGLDHIYGTQVYFIEAPQAA